MFKNAIQDVFIQSQANTRFPSYLTNITNKISNDTFAQYSFEYIFASRANLPNFTKKDRPRIKTLILLYARLLYMENQRRKPERQRGVKWIQTVARGVVASRRCRGRRRVVAADVDGRWRGRWRASLAVLAVAAATAAATTSCAAS